MLVASLLVAVLACPAPGSKDVVGLWESQQTSKGGIGHTLEFRDNGTFVEASTVLVNFHYRVDGSRLFLSEAASDDDTKRARDFRLEGNSLIETGPDGSSIRKERLNGRQAGSTGIVGEWRYRHYAGTTAFERYTSDGRMQFRLPMSSSSGCYALKEGRLSLVLRQKETVTTIERRAEELTVKSPGKPGKVYGRESAGPWYDREHITLTPPRKD
jgi:hypothetical protein